MTVTEMANYALKKQDYEKATSKQGSSDSDGNQSISDLERSYRNAEATGGDRWLCGWNPDVEPKHIVPLSKDIEDLVIDASKTKKVVVKHYDKRSAAQKESS